MLSLRYYCRGTGSVQVKAKLDQIARELGVPIEVIDLSRDGAYCEEVEKEVYQNDFKPRSRTLKQRTGESVTTLRSRSGQYFVSLPGTIAGVQDGKVEWFAIGDQDVLCVLNKILTTRGLPKDLLN